MIETAAPPAPADDPRSSAELEALLLRRTGVLAAIWHGLTLAARSAVIGLPTTLVFGTVSAAGGLLFLHIAEVARVAERPIVELWAQGTGALALFLTAYAAVQFGKRARVSRASWWPALFAAPAALVSGSLFLELSGTASQLPIVPSLLVMAWWLAYGSIGGAAAAIAWIRAGQAAANGTALGMGEVLSEVRRRTLEVSAPHGARVHAVTIGMQVLLPGIFYQLQYAFTDMIAVLDPERPPLRRSGQLTVGMRGRLFRLFLAWWLLTSILAAVIAAVADGGLLDMRVAASKWAELLIDPSAVSPMVSVVEEIVWALTTWVLTLSVQWLYVEREGQVRARTVLKGRVRAAV